MVSMMDFPALEGRPVTEAHMRVCRERGHASHQVAGESTSTGVCPRCGEVTATCPRCERRVERLLAMSRVDNRTSICDRCGSDEAMRDWAGREVWPGFPGPFEEE